MKHLLTVTALLISSLAMGQWPYNPDSNGDDLIGVSDLQSILTLYGLDWNADTIVVMRAEEIPMDSLGCCWFTQVIPDSIDVVLPPLPSSYGSNFYEVLFSPDRQSNLLVFGPQVVRQV